MTFSLPDDATLYLVFTAKLCRLPALRALEEALAAGVHVVQWRMPEAEAPGLADALRLAEKYSVPLIVNDDVAAAARHPLAAGAHVGQEDMAPGDARALLRDGQLLGISTHDVAQAQRAEREGADYLGIGPCYPTTTKGYDTGLAPGVLREVCARVQRPVFGIGGITARRVPLLRELGCDRVAVSSAILSAENPGLAVEQFLEALG